MRCISYDARNEKKSEENGILLERSFQSAIHVR